jgi:hypothetical protein
MKVRPTIGLAPVVLILSACAGTTPELDRTFLTGGEARKGIVVFSTTHTGQYRNKLSGTLEFACESGAKGKVRDDYGVVQYIDGERPPIPVGNPDVRPDHPMGRIHILELPAGTCVFNAYSAGASVMNNMSTTLTARPFAIRFTVPDHGVAYIGSYNMEWAPEAGRRSFNDYYDRDLRALKAQNVSLPGPIEKRIGSPEGVSDTIERMRNVRRMSAFGRKQTSRPT